jgi:hypothetical protein
LGITARIAVAADNEYGHEQNGHGQGITIALQLPDQQGENHRARTDEDVGFRIRHAAEVDVTLRDGAEQVDRAIAAIAGDGGGGGRFPGRWLRGAGLSSLSRAFDGRDRHAKRLGHRVRQRQRCEVDDY